MVCIVINNFDTLGLCCKVKTYFSFVIKYVMYAMDGFVITLNSQILPFGEFVNF